MPNWTDEQKAAIFANEENILVSAAAGSGKTAVLTERIVRMLTDKEKWVPINRLLVVTFTNAAAAEMRERIMSKLTERLESEPENELLERQLSLIASANIMTIHSFCLNMIKENFILADVDPAFKIADNAENEMLKLESIDEALDEMFEDDEFSDDFITFTESYSNAKNMKAVTDMALSVYNFVMSLPDPFSWLDEATARFFSDCDFDETIYAQLIVKNTKKTVRFLTEQYESLIELEKADDDVPELLELLTNEREELIRSLKFTKYSEYYDYFAGLKFEKIPSKNKKTSPVYREHIRKQRDKIKKNISESICANFYNITPAEQTDVIEKLRPSVKAFSEFIKRIIVRFDEKKKKKNILNFNDLEHICYRLFVAPDGSRTELAKKTEERFSEILIDEYQDTSKLQESIFSAIHTKNRLFMVGDIKQSIYRFRNTDPMLFLQKSECYEKNEDGNNRKISLSKNFRSKNEVISSVNFLFKRIMSSESGEINYDEDEMLNFGGSFLEAVNKMAPETEINIIDLAKAGEEDDEDETENEPLAMSSAEYEAELVADKIDELVSGGYEINDRGELRKIAYGDICVLMRQTAQVAPIFAEVLSKRGIPAFSDIAGGFFEAGEIEIILSYLKIIDNPNQDIPLLAVLRSPLYNFSTNELARIRKCAFKDNFYAAINKCKENEDDLAKRVAVFLDELSFYRLRQRVASVHELIWEIYTKSGFYDYVGATKNGDLKRGNLRNLYMHAVHYDQNGFKGLYGFITFMEEFNKTKNSDFSAAKMVGEEQNTVRIMSIHKSKGLEFPVCILSNCAGKFNTRDLNRAFLYHADYGFGPKYVDSVLRISYPTAAKSAISKVLYDELLAEEMRILYVALTRAKEKLILTGCVKNLKNDVLRWSVGENSQLRLSPARALSAKNFLDWIGMSLLNHKDGKIFADMLDKGFKIIDDESSFKLNICNPKSAAEETEDMSEYKSSGADVTDILSTVDKSYPNESFLGIPSKISVTEIKRRQNSEDDTIYMYKKAEPQKNKVSGAFLGTAVHTLMEHIDFKCIKNKDDVFKKANELFNMGFLSEDEKSAIDYDKVYAFFETELCKTIRVAKKVDREVMFAICETAKRLGIAESMAGVLVQGVIDMVVDTGEDLIIVDYKTDKNLSPDDAIRKYNVQLVCYNMAVEKLYGKKASHAYLYLFDTKEVAEVFLLENIIKESGEAF